MQWDEMGRHDYLGVLSIPKAWIDYSFDKELINKSSNSKQNKRKHKNKQKTLTQGYLETGNLIFELYYQMF